MDLSRLFAPRSIAVIGGGIWGANVVRHCRALGYDGEIWPVHPQEKPLEGLPSYASIEMLPSAPDAAYICVNRHETIKTVQALSARGAGGAVCLASGFREATAEDENATSLQDELLAAAGLMPLIGPNCYGFINYLDRVSLWPDQQGGIPRERGVAILAQSSNIAMNLTMVSSGLPISHIFAVGNQAQLDMAELALHLVEDERVRAIGLHIEGIKNLRNFEELARRADELGKPIVALKVGRSEAAKVATISHTASMAGDHVAAEALFARLGFVSTDNLAHFTEALKLAGITGHLPHAYISSMSCSGGEASLVADAALDCRVEFSPIEGEVREGLRNALGPMVALANPLDYHTYIWRNEDKLAETFTAMAQGDHSINLVVIDYPREDRCDQTDWITVENAVFRAREATGANFAIVTSLASNLPEARAEALLAHDIVPMAGIHQALHAISQLAWARYQAEEPVLITPMPENLKRIEEAEAKTLLREAGLDVPRGRRLKNGEKLPDDLEYPVVLKGEGFAHKSEAGAVVLNLYTEEAVLEAMEVMDAKGYLIEPMIDDAIAEILLGITLDPAHGYMLTIGAGGVMTEVLRDTVTLLVPATADDVELAIDDLQIAPILRGFRGKPGIDMSKLVDAIMRLQEFVQFHAGQVSEVEINPILAGQDFAKVVDALIIANFDGQ